MKRRVPSLIKRIMAALSTKTNELRTRITIFFLLHRNQTLLLDKFQAVLAGRRKAAVAAHSIHSRNKNSDEDDDEDGEGESFSMYMNTEPQQQVCISTANQVSSYTNEMNVAEDINNCIDLTHILLKESEEEMKKGGVDISEQYRASNSTATAKMEIMEDGRLEEEEDVDHAADMFIERFRKQILLQKQLSLQEGRSPARIYVTRTLQKYGVSRVGHSRHSDTSGHSDT